MPVGQITFTTRAIPARKRGVGHRHERWGGKRWTRQRQAREVIAGRFSVSDRQRVDERRCGVRQSRVVLAPVAGVKSAEVFSGPTGSGKTFNPPMTVTRRIRRRGEHEISRKTIARGMPGQSGGPVVTTLVWFYFFHARLRVHWAPGIPCALCLEGR